MHTFLELVRLTLSGRDPLPNPLKGSFCPKNPHLHPLKDWWVVPDLYPKSWFNGNLLRKSPKMAKSLDTLSDTGILFFREINFTNISNTKPRGGFNLFFREINFSRIQEILFYFSVKSQVVWIPRLSLVHSKRHQIYPKDVLNQWVNHLERLWDPNCSLQF